MRGNVGYRIFTDIERADQALVERFSKIPTSNIGDMMNRLYCMDAGISPMNSRPMAGTAITVKAPIGDNMVFHYALDIAQPGDVIVVDGAGACARSLAGEIMMNYAANKGIAGIVVDGALRDRNGLAACPMPIYCRAITPQGPYKHGPGEINVPVCCGGIAVLPGDILIGDGDGIVVIHKEDALAVIEKAEKKRGAEDAIMASGFALPGHAEEYRKKLQEKDCTIL